MFGYILATRTLSRRRRKKENWHLFTFRQGLIKRVGKPPGYDANKRRAQMDVCAQKLCEIQLQALVPVIFSCTEQERLRALNRPYC